MNAVDVVVIGAGPAGLSAAIYLSRSQLKTLIIGDIEKNPWHEATVENYLGVSSASGREISLTGLEQAKRFGSEHIVDEATSARQVDDGFIITTSKQNEIRTKAIIIATGVSRKKAGIAGEDQFEGRGVHYCTLCDGFFYANKKVAVLGSGSHAAQEAILLSQFTKDISIISPTPFSFSQELERAVSGLKKRNEKIKMFKGDKKLTHLVFETGEEAFDGVFVAAGITGAVSFATKLGLELNKDNTVKVDRNQHTNIKGVFAAGNCTGGNMQATKSAGEGCNAAIEVIKLLKDLEKYVDH